MNGYSRNPELTAQKVVDGWLRTGDLGEMDTDGKLFIYGRLSQYLQAPDGQKVYLFDMANELR